MESLLRVSFMTLSVILLLQFALVASQIENVPAKVIMLQQIVKKSLHLL